MMRALTRQLHLHRFVQGAGHHDAASRLRRPDPDAVVSLAHRQRVTRIAEAAILAELLRRGSFRRDDAGRTLRDHHGPARPARNVGCSPH
jgi:hypothetical protein